MPKVRTESQPGIVARVYEAEEKLAHRTYRIAELSRIMSRTRIYEYEPELREDDPYYVKARAILKELKPLMTADDKWFLAKRKKRSNSFRRIGL
jgi:hypothetical protein